MTKDKRYLEVSPKKADGGFLIGKNPFKISVDLLHDLGHPRTPMKSIRAKCLDCTGDSESEVRKCVQHDCPLWPMRMGRSPYRVKGKAR